MEAGSANIGREEPAGPAFVCELAVLSNLRNLKELLCAVFVAMDGEGRPAGDLAQALSIDRGAKVGEEAIISSRALGSVR